MMFSCIHPGLAEETQLALVLHLVCGFGMDETAAAFLKDGAAMQKRLRRAKTALAGSNQLFVLDDRNDVADRLPTVTRAVYLLFNEGYHGASAESAVRAELCAEAMRLVALLLENPATSNTTTHALAALLSFLAARLPARVDATGNLILLMDQDRSRWDAALIAEGRRQLDLSASGTEVTAYHIEAAIASLHAEAPSAGDTDWAAIASLYETLMIVQPSPVVALNRAVALAQRDGPARGLEEIGKIAGRRRLLRYPFYFTALGEFEFRLGHAREARRQFEAALRLARNAAERHFLEGRIQNCGSLAQRH